MNIIFIGPDSSTPVVRDQAYVVWKRWTAIARWSYSQADFPGVSFTDAYLNPRVPTEIAAMHALRVAAFGAFVRAIPRPGLPEVTWQPIQDYGMLGAETASGLAADLSSILSHNKTYTHEEGLSLEIPRIQLYQYPPLHVLRVEDYAYGDLSPETPQVLEVTHINMHRTDWKDVNVNGWRDVADVADETKFRRYMKYSVNGANLECLMSRDFVAEDALPKVVKGAARVVPGTEASLFSTRVAESGGQYVAGSSRNQGWELRPSIIISPTVSGGAYGTPLVCEMFASVYAVGFKSSTGRTLSFDRVTSDMTDTSSPKSVASGYWYSEPIQDLTPMEWSGPYSTWSSHPENNAKAIRFRIH